MIKFLCPLFLFLSIQPLYAQHRCCNAVETFAGFTGDLDFVQAHEEPEALSSYTQMGSMVTYTCDDSTTAQIYVLQSVEPSNKYLLVFHEWWGLNDHIKQVCDQLYQDLDTKVHVIAFDLYDGKVAAGRDSAQVYMQNLSPERAKMMVRSLTAKFGDDVEIATIGWCMGGGYSLQASILNEERGKACVMYYGMPETDTTRLNKLNADVLMIWPNQDKWITAAVVEKFQQDMASAGKELHVEEYAADHAFANPSNPKHDAALAEDAYAKSLQFIRQKFTW